MKKLSKYLHNPQIFSNFKKWDRWGLQLTDKGMLTAFPIFKICRHNLNVRSMNLPKVNSKRWLDLTDIDGEIWKDVVGFEGFYKVSNFGRVKVLHRNQIRANGKVLNRKERILRQCFNAWGYYQISLTKFNDKHKSARVHRLVAMAFIPNPDKSPFVNHKDEVKTNNQVDNLEWCTPLYNMNYGTRIKRAATARRKTCKGMRRQVSQYDKKGNYIATYDDYYDASTSVGIDRTMIHKCLKGKNKIGGGYIWRYEKTDRISPYIHPNSKKYKQLNVTI